MSVFLTQAYAITTESRKNLSHPSARANSGTDRTLAGLSQLGHAFIHEGRLGSVFALVLGLTETQECLQTSQQFIHTEK